MELWVESTDPVNHLLATDVIYYIHDSFSPPVFTYKPEEFTADGKAIENKILSYGAFTVGVVTDNG
ncbi:MAG TPA: pYEATS domain-containing protein [Flavisolibacter sp.]|nr:pYEATS domain-containing protein [Flavisolibacter sp.]